MFANKLFDMFGVSLSSSCGLYHGIWHEDPPSKWIVTIPTLWGMIFALGLGVLMSQPELYRTYGRVILRNFFHVIILMIDAMIINNNMILEH